MPRRTPLFTLVAALALALFAGPGTALAGPEQSIVIDYPAAGAMTYGYGGTVTVTWTETGVDPAAPHRLTRESAPVNRAGGCGDVTYAPDGEWAVTGTAADVPGQQANHCYRYRVLVDQPKVGTYESPPSGALRALKPWTGKVNVYRSGVFSTQKTWTWCVGASVQMMRNIMDGTEYHGRWGQKVVMKYSRSHDRIPDHVSPGTDPQGWAAALRHFTGIERYRWHQRSSFTAAIEHAAQRLRRTGNPIGLLMARGGHAWVMHGFEATADPGLGGDFTITHVYVSGPLYPMQQSNGWDRPPNTRLSVSTLSRYFVRFRGVPRENSMIWDQTYVTIAG